MAKKRSNQMTREETISRTYKDLDSAFDKWKNGEISLMALSHAVVETPGAKDALELCTKNVHLNKSDVDEHSQSFIDILVKHSLAYKHDTYYFFGWGDDNAFSNKTLPMLMDFCRAEADQKLINEARRRVSVVTDAAKVLLRLGVEDGTSIFTGEVSQLVRGNADKYIKDTTGGMAVNIESEWAKENFDLLDYIKKHPEILDRINWLEELGLLMKEKKGSGPAELVPTSFGDLIVKTISAPKKKAVADEAHNLTVQK